MGRPLLATGADVPDARDAPADPLLLRSSCRVFSGWFHGLTPDGGSGGMAGFSVSIIPGSSCPSGHQEFSGSVPTTRGFV